MTVSNGLSEQSKITSGYTHARYAKSLAEFGTPRELPRCGGWVLERKIPGFPDWDAMGCYPLFTCQDWSQLYLDLEDIGKDLVSLSLVTDPFGNFDVAYLTQCFKDFVLPFKQHFIVDLNCPLNTFVSKHHHRYAKSALGALQIERCKNPAEFINDWVNLYDFLIKRHDIKGISAFSKSAFASQMRVPGITVFRATHHQTTVGMAMWYVNGVVGYYHLGAFNPIGYKLRASFALFWYAINYFADLGLKLLNLGGGAGIKNNGTDGLSRFKRGWSTESRIAYFCGRIFHQARYSEIVKKQGIIPTNYFPAYRQGEFA